MQLNEEEAELIHHYRNASRADQLQIIHLSKMFSRVSAKLAGITREGT